MDFKLTGVSIGMDIAIVFAALGLIYSWWKDRQERKQKEVDAVNQLIFNEIQKWDPLLDAFFSEIKKSSSGDLNGLHRIHDEIWSNLKKLRALAAAQAQKETYATLAKHIEAYQNHMQSGHVKDGFIELGKMLRSMMDLLQTDETVLDDYFISRFGETMRSGAA